MLDHGKQGIQNEAKKIKPHGNKLSASKLSKVLLSYLKNKTK